MPGAGTQLTCPHRAACPSSDKTDSASPFHQKFSSLIKNQRKWVWSQFQPPQSSTCTQGQPPSAQNNEQELSLSSHARVLLPSPELGCGKHQLRPSGPTRGAAGAAALSWEGPLPQAPDPQLNPTALFKITSCSSDKSKPRIRGFPEQFISLRQALGEQ